MAKPHPLLKQFAKHTKINVAGWSATETEPMLLVSQIPSRDDASAFLEFLSGMGMVCTLFMGDKRGTTWNLSARSAMPSILEESE